MLSMRQWRHERSVTPDGDGKTVVRDRLTFELRAPLRPADTRRRGGDSRTVRTPAPSACSGISPTEFIDDAGDVQGDGQAGLVERPLQHSRDLVEAVDERIAMDVKAIRRPRDVECAVAPRDQRRAQRRPLTVGQQRCEQAFDEAGPGIDRHDRQGLMESHVFDLVDLRRPAARSAPAEGHRRRLARRRSVRRYPIRWSRSRHEHSSHVPRAPRPGPRQRSVTSYRRASPPRPPFAPAAR